MRLSSASKGVGPVWVGLRLYPQTGLYQRGPLRPRNSVREQREVGHAAPNTERLPLLPGFLAAGTGCPNVARLAGSSLSRLGRVAPLGILQSINWSPACAPGPE